MSKKQSETSEMSSVEFAQFALRDRVAPPAMGSKKERLSYATRTMVRHGWTENRVRDFWYADARIKPSADEIRDLEALTGLTYGRRELGELDTLIARADALLEGQDPDFYSPFGDAVRAFIRALAGARTGRGTDQD